MPNQRTSPDHAPAGRPISLAGPRSIIAVAMTAALLAGCRGDSFTAPNAVDCTGEPGCRTSPSAQVDPVVYASLDDAAQRLAPLIGMTSTQQALAASLHAVSQALREGRTSDARASLARVYQLIAPFRVTRSDGTKADLPDVAALRLDLVPAANTLGVQIS